jgi:tetratricopeptide (TPR) repeat protein
LLDAQPAYAAYEAGQTALREERSDDAERQAGEAVRLLPAAAQFHALLGDIDYSRQRYQDALAHYRDAATRNDRFFYYKLRKGQAHQRLSQWSDAEAEFASSIALLPTADAYYGLGSLAERRGDRGAALENYRQAAESMSPAGQAAQDAIVRLDLPSNPSQYLSVRSGLDESGQLRIEAANPTRLAIADIVLVVRYADAQGALQTQRFNLNNGLQPNASQTLATGLGPFTSTQSYEVSIASARVVTE